MEGGQTRALSALDELNPDILRDEFRKPRESYLVILTRADAYRLPGLSLEDSAGRLKHLRPEFHRRCPRETTIIVLNCVLRAYQAVLRRENEDMHSILGSLTKILPKYAEDRPIVTLNGGK